MASLTLPVRSGSFSVLDTMPASGESMGVTVNHLLNARIGVLRVPYGPRLRDASKLEPVLSSRVPTSPREQQKPRTAMRISRMSSSPQAAKQQLVATAENKASAVAACSPDAIIAVQGAGGVSVKASVPVACCPGSEHGSARPSGPQPTVVRTRRSSATAGQENARAVAVKASVPVAFCQGPSQLTFRTTRRPSLPDPGVLSVLAQASPLQSHRDIVSLEPKSPPAQSRDQVRSPNQAHRTTTIELKSPPFNSSPPSQRTLATLATPAPAFPTTKSRNPIGPGRHARTSAGAPKVACLSSPRKKTQSALQTKLGRFSRQRSGSESQQGSGTKAEKLPCSPSKQCQDDSASAVCSAPPVGEAALTPASFPGSPEMLGIEDSVASSLPLASVADGVQEHGIVGQVDEESCESPNRVCKNEKPCETDATAEALNPEVSVIGTRPLSATSERKGKSEVRLRAIFVRTGILIDAICFEYDDGTKHTVQSGYGGTWQSPFVLAHDEHVVAISGTQSWLFYSVSFVTSSGRKSMRYGNFAKGTPFHLHATQGSQIWSVVCSTVGSVKELVERPAPEPAEEARTLAAADAAKDGGVASDSEIGGSREALRRCEAYKNQADSMHSSPEDTAQASPVNIDEYFGCIDFIRSCPDLLKEITEDRHCQYSGDSGWNENSESFSDATTMSPAAMTNMDSDSPTSPILDDCSPTNIDAIDLSKDTNPAARLPVEAAAELQSVLSDVEMSSESLAREIEEKDELISACVAEVARLKRCLSESAAESEAYLKRASSAERLSQNLAQNLRTSASAESLGRRKRRSSRSASESFSEYGLGSFGDLDTLPEDVVVTDWHWGVLFSGA